MSQTLLPELDENKFIVKKSNYISTSFNVVLKIYFLCFGVTVVYYLVLMNNKLEEFNNKIVLMRNVGKCLFKDICYDFKLGREICGNCYPNMSFV